MMPPLAKGGLDRFFVGSAQHFITQPVVLVIRRNGDNRPTRPEVKNMPKPPPRPPAEIIKSIDSKAVRVREAAADLTKRIEHFEIYLSHLNGRVEACCLGPHPDYTEGNTPFELALRFHRDGKSWAISHAVFDSFAEDFSENWAPLKEASLKIKIAGIKLFPDLLGSIEQSQDDLVNEIRQASEDFDEFTKTLPDMNRTSPISDIAQQALRGISDAATNIVKGITVGGGK